MRHESTIALIALIFVVSAVAIFGSGPTGNIVRGTWGWDIRNTPEVPVYRTGMVLGYELGPEHAKTCRKLMRYQGREYTRYLQCCKYQCLPDCTGGELESYEVTDCMAGCEVSCVDEMTEYYLSFKPGTWR